MAEHLLYSHEPIKAEGIMAKERQREGLTQLSRQRDREDNWVEPEARNTRQKNRRNEHNDVLPSLLFLGLMLVL